MRPAHAGDVPDPVAISGLAGAPPAAGAGDEVVPAWRGRFAQRAKQAIAMVQQAIDDLREEVLGDVLTAIATMWGAAEGIDVSLDVSPGVPTTGEMRHELAEILHQALRSVGKHAHASRVRVVLRTSDEQLALSIADNGDGSLPRPEGAPARADACSELSRIAARVARLGGSLSVRSWQSLGNCLLVQVPMPALVDQASSPALPAPALGIAISNSDPVVRSGLRALFAQMPGVEIVAESTDAPGPDLTRREWEILGLIAEGLSNRQIAARLIISPKTVKNHICNIYRLIGVNERSQAVSRWQGHCRTGRAIAKAEF